MDKASFEKGGEGVMDSQPKSRNRTKYTTGVAAACSLDSVLLEQTVEVPEGDVAVDPAGRQRPPIG